MPTHDVDPFTKDQQIDNCRKAIALMERLPDVEVRLNLWQQGNLRFKPKKQYECGTIACLGGHIALDAEFQQIGVFAAENSGGSPKMLLDDCATVIENANNVAHFLFGDHCMFYTRSETEYSGEMADVSDREVAINRLKRQLNKLESMSK